MAKSKLRTDIDDFCDETWSDEDILLFGNSDGDPYDEGFIGIGFKQYEGPVAVYDRDKCIDALARQFGEDTNAYEGDEDADPYTDAVEWFNFNTEGSYVGKQTPIIVSRFNGDRSRAGAIYGNQ